MNTYLKKIQAGFLAVLLFLSVVSCELPLSAAAQIGSIIFEDDFEDKTDWVSLAEAGWQSSNGGGVSISEGKDGKCACIYSYWGSSLNAPAPKTALGIVDVSFDMMMNKRNVDGVYVQKSDETAPSECLLKFEWRNNAYEIYAYGADIYNTAPLFTLHQNQWINVKILLDLTDNNYSAWITDEEGTSTNIIADLSVPVSGIGSIVFYDPPYGVYGVPEADVGEFKLDNFKLSQLILNTGVDEDFDSYTDITELPADWSVEGGENVSVSDGTLRFSGEAKVQNIHKAYNVDSLNLNGDIRYPTNAGDDDSLTVSVMIGDSVIDILKLQGNGQINNQPTDMLIPGQNLHFDAIIKKGSYTISIDDIPAAEGTFSDDFSEGVTGIVICTSGNADWSIDNLKSLPALNQEQMDELREDLREIIIEEPKPGSVISLPSKGVNGSEVTWKCSPKSVIDVETGVVNFPDWELGPTDVILTCKVTKYGMSLSKSFNYHMEPAINNLFQNGDFEQIDESGIPIGWFSTSGRPLQTSDNAQHGERSALISGRGDSTHSGAQYITLKPNRSYHFSGYVKLADEIVEGQDGRISVWLQGGRVNSTAGELTNYVTSFNAFYMNTNEWININSDFNTNINPQEWPTSAYIYPFPVGSTTLSFYMDNFEIYEYVLNNLRIRGDDVIDAPQSGETVKLYRAEALNQYGTKTGMENLEFEWSFDRPVNGISVNNKGELTVNEYAENQTFQLICKAKEGTVAGSTWIEGRKTVSVTNNTSDSPRVYQLSIVGKVKPGETLKAEYKYFQKDGLEEGDSAIQWYASDEYDSGYQEISGQTSSELFIDEVLAEKYIRFSVTPKSVSGIVGSNAISSSITKNREPIAVDVSVKGNAVLGEKIIGSYGFIDYNGDEEGNSQYSWLIGDNEDSDDFKVIEGATDRELVVTEAMENKFIRFEVVPVSKAEPEYGAAVQSPALIGPAKPEIKEVKIIGRASAGNVLSVDYTFYDRNNDAENNSIIKWYCGDTLLKESATYIPGTADEGKQIIAEVTPVSEKYPFTGIPIRSSAVTVSRSGGNNITVGGGGSGGKGSFSSAKSTTEPIIEHINENTNSTVLYDIAGHWAEKDINELAMMGIFKGKSENLFSPEDCITRAEFLTCIMRSINAEMTVYNGVFEDVSSDNWYADTVQTALDYGIISQARKFNPNAFITREEMAKMIAQAYMFMMNGQWPLDYDLSSFSDYEQISDWATGYMVGCLTLGLLRGYGDGTLNPSANATRAQAAVIMNRLIHLIY